MPVACEIEPRMGRIVRQKRKEEVNKPLPLSLPYFLTFFFPYFLHLPSFFSLFLCLLSFFGELSSGFTSKHWPPKWPMSAIFVFLLSLYPSSSVGSSLAGASPLGCTLLLLVLSFGIFVPRPHCFFGTAVFWIPPASLEPSSFVPRLAARTSEEGEEAEEDRAHAPQTS